MSESHNPISQEGESIHEMSNEEKAKQMGVGLDEFHNQVLTLKPSDTETVEEVRKIAERNNYDDGSRGWFMGEIARQLLVDGNLNISEFLKSVYQKYKDRKFSDLGYEVNRGIRIEIEQNADQAVGYMKDFLEGKKKAA